MKTIPISIRWLYKKVLIDSLFIIFSFIILSLFFNSTFLILYFIILVPYTIFLIRFYLGINSYKTIFEEKSLTIPYNLINKSRRRIYYGDIQKLQIKTGLLDHLFNTTSLIIHHKSSDFKYLFWDMSGIAYLFKTPHTPHSISIIGINKEDINQVVKDIEEKRDFGQKFTGIEILAVTEKIGSPIFKRIMQITIFLIILFGIWVFYTLFNLNSNFSNQSISDLSELFKANFKMTSR